MWQVVGQTRAVTLLERSIKIGQLSHVHLFIGPTHIGKLTLAVNLAQAVNCEAENAPCSECNSCHRIASGKHADVQVIGLASADKRELSIDQMREMQTSACLPPYEGKHKVFIIENADLLSNEAANCLLKVLEEPSPQVNFILLTARERLLLPTVISRCHRVELHRIPSNIMEDVLCNQYGLSKQKADLLARLSGGCFGWAMLAMQDERILEERTRRLDFLADLNQASHKQRLSYAAELATQFNRAKEEVEEVLALWIKWWRDLLLVKSGNGKYITNIDQKSTLLDQVGNYGIGQIKDFIHYIQVASKQLEQNANPRLALEVLMLNMP
ncbi:ATP-binding protein [Chloroflexota bacterium]